MQQFEDNTVALFYQKRSFSHIFSVNFYLIIYVDAPEGQWGQNSAFRWFKAVIKQMTARNQLPWLFECMFYQKHAWKQYYIIKKKKDLYLILVTSMTVLLLFLLLL